MNGKHILAPCQLGSSKGPQGLELDARLFAVSKGLRCTSRERDLDPYPFGNAPERPKKEKNCK